MQRWTDDFLAAVKDVPAATDPAQSAAVLRSLVKSELLKFTDMRDQPEKFFMAHRHLATVGLGGFGIRFTVQFNLFAGSIVGLASEEQIAMLDDIQKAGKLGCFLLTEMQAGVLSGLIVETTCTWDPDTQEFVLHTPSDKAAKNWISQGFVAECGVVIADLQIDGKSYGPHPFYLDLREEDMSLKTGIRIEDMGVKTIANDLDNARVWFDQVRLPKSSMLNKFADIKDDQYVQVGDERMRIEVIGQRLLTGRIAIAEAALYSARVLHMKTEAYAKEKKCNGLAGETNLLSMPQMKNVLRESYEELDRMMAFTAGVENELNECLKNGTIPDAELVEKIAVCKIKCIEVAVERVHQLRLEVGSYALMHDTGFELVDMLLCCKFAEGDSRILQQKLARDRLRKLQRSGVSGEIGDMFVGRAFSESVNALKLAQKLAPAGRDMKKLGGLMDEHWSDIYELADQICERHINDSPGGDFLEPCVARLSGANFDFDSEWKDKI
jgi:acyl-CoA oxidase